MLTSYLHDLLDWTQLKRGKFSKNITQFNLQELFSDIIEMMRFKAELKDIYCKLEVEDDLPYLVNGDQQRLM